MDGESLGSSEERCKELALLLHLEAESSQLNRESGSYSTMPKWTKPYLQPQVWLKPQAQWCLSHTQGT